jgi:DNA-binding NarL/FixJ family response regulator
VIRVAIVEDRADVRDSLRSLVSGAPEFEVTGAYPSMEAALHGLEQVMPDTVVMDLGLPGMSGIEGIRFLRERYPKLIMIALTVFEDDHRIFEAICAGAQGYLLKNAPASKLLDGIREAMDGGVPLSPSVARRVMELFRRFRPPESADHDLTPHEIRVLRLMAEGHNTTTAAKALGVSANTVSYHLKNIYPKLRGHSKAEAVAKAHSSTESVDSRPPRHLWVLKALISRSSATT